MAHNTEFGVTGDGEALSKGISVAEPTMGAEMTAGLGCAVLVMISIGRAVVVVEDTGDGLLLSMGLGESITLTTGDGVTPLSERGGSEGILTAGAGVVPGVQGVV